MIKSFRHLTLCFFRLLATRGFCLYLVFFLLSADTVLLFLLLAFNVEKNTGRCDKEKFTVRVD